MTKQEYVQSLKKEVEQFHPFLKDRLFAAMQKKGLLCLMIIRMEIMKMGRIL